MNYSVQVLALVIAAANAKWLRKPETPKELDDYSLVRGVLSANAEALEEKSLLREKLTDDDGLKIKFLYTYGAPAITKKPINPNEGSYDTCIPGARVYTKNWYAGRWYSDAAAQVTVLQHPMLDAIELRKKDGDIIEQDEVCLSNRGEPFSGRKVWQYPRSSANTPLWDIHNQGIYQQRMWDLKDSMYKFEPVFNYTKFTRCINTQQCLGGTPNSHYRTEDEYAHCLKEYDICAPDEFKDFSAHWDDLLSEDWNLIGYHEFYGGSTDSDRVAVVQKDQNSPVVSEETTDCVIVFQGSGGKGDIGRFFDNLTSDYCGWSVHNGVKAELKNIIKDEAYGSVIVPALQKCGDITAIGHSLGGSLADMFFMCANYGDETSQDYLDLMAGGWGSAT